MRMVFKTRRSAGVRVSRRVHAVIGAGNLARNEGRVEEAISSYRAAVAMASDLPHVFVQIGHLLKDAGRLDEADATYAEADAACPEYVDALLHRARLARHRARYRLAISCLSRILLRDRENAEAWTELEALFFPLGRLRRLELEPFLGRFMGANENGGNVAASFVGTAGVVGPAGATSSDQRSLVLDVTDLIDHFQENRLPNGIQRVQAEVLTALIAEPSDRAVSACGFVKGREGWIEVPFDLCRDLTRMAAVSADTGEPAWREARARLFVHLMLADAYVLPWRATLVNLGVSTWVHDYFRYVRNAKADRLISYIPFIYDMIPVVRPEYCVAGWIREFTSWLIGVFQHADGYLPISHSANRDMIAIAAKLGHRVDERRTEVIPLDADFRRPGKTLPIETLDQWGLADVAFALLVSTIEPRKNHALAFDAWALLLRRHGPASVPRLVCVGRDGWMNDAVFDRLDTDPLLAAHVTLIHRASDDALALLYSECRFTVFPSLYEGWGLPVTEALSHAKLAIVADNSSLPEAGNGLALMFESGSISALAAAVERAAFDEDWRMGREAEIRQAFDPRTWQEIAAQIASAPARILPDVCEPIVPDGSPRLYYPVSLYDGGRLWPGLVSGEIFRSGAGWLWPEAGHCRTRPDGGALTMRVTGGVDSVMRLYVRVRGLDRAECSVTIDIVGETAGKAFVEGVVRRGKHRWLAIDIPNASDPFTILIKGALSETVQTLTGDTEASVAVAGFYLCPSHDAAANAAFIAARREDIAAISAYTPPT